jgi:outer membrane receptor protein involved in Fe transport
MRMHAYLFALLLVPGIATPVTGTAALQTRLSPPAQAAIQQSGDRLVEGLVVDQQGLPVTGASIVLTQRQGTLRKSTLSSTEKFRLESLVPALYDVRIEAAGFEAQSLTVDLRNQPVAVLDVRLEPARVAEQLIVTATRTEQRMGDVPASVSVLRGEEIRQSPALVADDVLRQLPSFSLFRRTSSLAAHPTAQGVSLRGVGPSGVSRTLVLLDDVPFNDPFGGWVYWTRVPLMSVDRIEVVDGATSSLYGNYAMGGVINIVTSRPARRTVEFRPQYGNRNSPKVDFFTSDVWGKLGVAVQGSALDTDGYAPVATVERGSVDTNASVNYRNFDGKLDYSPEDRVNVFFRGGYFKEDRNNGKVSTIDGTPEANDTTWKYANGGVRIRLPDQSDFQARVFTDFQTFRSNFLAVPAATPPRSIGRMTLNQEVPSKAVGGMVQWSRALTAKQYFAAGTDWRWVDGDSNEHGLDAVTGTTVTLERVSGGTQRSVGVFVQDIVSVAPELQLTLSARLDHWRNYDGHNLETTVATGLPTANHNPSLPTSDDTVVSPRVAALYHVTDWVTAWGGISGGFRAPTLNELYRQFRVGTVLTLANPQLVPERLVGGEFGVNVAPLRDVTWRTTWFDNRVKNPVSNVTQTIVGTQITRQRQNLGRTRVWGIQTDIEYRVGSFWRLSGGYIYDDARVKEYSADPRLNPSLVGKVLPQVPKHRGSLQAAYTNPKYVSLAVQAQFVGKQFDDDLNQARVAGQDEPGLPKYGVLDLTGSRAIGPNLEVFFGVQNVFDREYFVMTNPTTVGTPRLVNGGVRIRFVGR